MARSVTMIKDILRREERVLAKLREALPVIAHRETNAELREIVKTKRGEIKTYKAIIKASEKCPAVKKTAKKPVRKSGCR